MSVEPREEAVHNAARAFGDPGATAFWTETARIVLRAEPLAALTPEHLHALDDFIDEETSLGIGPRTDLLEAWMLLRAELQRREEKDG